MCVWVGGCGCTLVGQTRGESKPRRARTYLLSSSMLHASCTEPQGTHGNALLPPSPVRTPPHPTPRPVSLPPPLPSFTIPSPTHPPTHRRLSLTHKHTHPSIRTSRMPSSSSSLPTYLPPPPPPLQPPPLTHPQTLALAVSVALLRLREKAQRRKQQQQQQQQRASPTHPPPAVRGTGLVLMKLPREIVAATRELAAALVRWWVGGWVRGWVGGWVGGCTSCPERRMRPRGSWPLPWCVSEWVGG